MYKSWAFSLLGATSMAVVPLVQNASNVKSTNMGPLVGTWYSRFQSFSFASPQNPDQYWIVGETLIENERYKVTSNGANNGHDVFNLYIKELNKYYAIQLDHSPFNKDVTIKGLIKEELGNNIIAKFEQEMIHREYGKSLDIFLNAKSNDTWMNLENLNSVNFFSAAGIPNSDQGSFKSQINISADMISQMITQINVMDPSTHLLNDNYVLRQSHLTSMRAMPSFQVIDPPIQQALISLNNIYLNNFNTMMPTFPGILPEGSDIGTEWWRLITSPLKYVGWILMFIPGPWAVAIGSLAAITSFIADQVEAGNNYTIADQNIVKELSKHQVNFRNSVNVLDTGIHGNVNGNYLGGAAATSVDGDKSTMILNDLILDFTLDSVYDVYQM